MKVDVQVSNGQRRITTSQSHSETGPMKKGSGKPSLYRKRSATRNSSSTTGKKAKVVQGEKNSKWWSTPSVSTTSRGRGVFSNSFSSYSSGRQISPLPESVATDHFKQVGSFSTAGSRVDLYCHQFFWTCQWRGTQTGISCFKKRFSHSSAERCFRISEPSSYSRFLFPPYSCTKEKWGNETCDRSLRPESASIVPHFKMETDRSIRGSIQLGMWTTSLDWTDAYFHIHISLKFRKFLKFVGKTGYTLSRRCLLAYLQPFQYLPEFSRQW